jgi:phage terminase small subunit
MIPAYISSSPSPNRNSPLQAKTKSPSKKSHDSIARKESRDKMAKYHTRSPEQPNELDPRASEVQRYVSEKRLKRKEQDRSTSNNAKMYSSLYGSYEPVLKDRQYLTMVHGDRSSSHRRNKSYTGEKPFHYNSSQNMHTVNHLRSKSGLFASTKTLTPVVQDNFIYADEKSYRARMVKEYITPTNKNLYLSQTSAKKSREKTVRKVRDMVRVSQSNYDIQEKEQKY